MTRSDHQTRWLIGAGCVCGFLQLILDCGLIFDIKAWWWGEVSVIMLFIGFPFGFALAIALLLLRRWLAAILFLSLAIVTWCVVVRAANEVRPIDASAEQR